MAPKRSRDSDQIEKKSDVLESFNRELPPTSSAFRSVFDSDSDSDDEKTSRKKRKAEETSKKKSSSAFYSCVNQKKKACRYCSCKPPGTPVEDSEATKALKPEDIEILREKDRERRRKRKELEEELLREPPFRAICIKAAELKAYSRHPDSDHNEDKVQNDVRGSVEEELRKQNQARCASNLARRTEMRLGDIKIGTESVLKSINNFKLEEDHGEDRTWLKIGGRMLDFVKTETKALPDWLCKKSRSTDGCDQKLKTDTVPMNVKLTGVTIFPKVDGRGGDSIVGTLEADSHRFIYTASSYYFHSRITYEFDNVKEVFFQDEEEKMPALLHFRLHHPIKVGTEKREDIQFRLVPIVVGERKSDSDSEMFEKEKQTRDTGRSKDLTYFVGKVGDERRGSCPPFSFLPVIKRGEFHGVLPSKKASDVFVVSYASVLQLSSTPFVVVNLQDIEIVHLARLRPEVVDMTVVFKDFNRPVLQISSIPSDSLEGIKRTIDHWNVKFYENNLKLEWSSIMRNITKDVESFIRDGGWGAYGLHDSASSIYNMHYYLELSQAATEKREIIWG